MSQRSTLLTAIDDVLHAPCLDPVTHQTVRGTELLRRVLVRKADSGNRDAEELLKAMDHNRRCKGRRKR